MFPLAEGVLVCLRWDCAQGRTHLQLALRRQSEVVLFSVDLPSQDCLFCQSGGVSLPHLISGDGLLSEAAGGCVHLEECVNATEEVA